MRYCLFLFLAITGSLPLACNNLTPTSTGGTSPHRVDTVTSTPTNLNGWTSTPTPTFQPTVAYVGTFAAPAPNGITYSSSQIYVAEGDGASVSQVQVFNSGTNALNWTWTNYNGVNFKGPNGVVANSAGTTVYILDVNPNSNYAGAVYAVAPAATPTPITSWTSFGGTTLNAPSGIALDSTGNVYVADTGNGTLEEYGPGGVTIASWTTSNLYPIAVALDSSNNVYVADGNLDRLYALAPSGSTFSVTTHWNLPSITYSQDQGNLDVYGLAVDSSNNVYVADYYNSQVEVYTNGGTQLGVFTGDNGGSATPLAGPDGILLYNNDLYIADYDSNNGSSTTGIIEIFGPNTY